MLPSIETASKKTHEAGVDAQPGSSFTQAETVKLPLLSTGGSAGAVNASLSGPPVSDSAEAPAVRPGPHPACAPRVAPWPLPVASAAVVPLPSSSFHQASSGGLPVGETVATANSAGGLSGLRLPARSTACTNSVRLPTHTGEIWTVAAPPSE